MSARIASACGTRRRHSAIIAAAPSMQVTLSPRATYHSAMGCPDPQPRSSTSSPGGRPATVARSAGSSHIVRLRVCAQRGASAS